MNFHKLFNAVVTLLALSIGTQALAARTTTYYHNDGLGSVVAATNEAGQVLWRKDYAPFGEQIDTTPDTERQSYTGKPHDDVTGLSYFGGRYYDPQVARFMSVDPVAFVDNNTMSFNRYLYVNNNPYKYVDPDGEFLNFAAKFILDVGLNIAINYATSGSFGIGMALKDSATGILNPAKTVAKFGKLAKILTKGSSKGASSVKTGYHATHPAAASSILKDGFKPGTKPGRLGSGGTYVNDTPTGAAAEFAHHNPGKTPAILKVEYQAGVNASAGVAPRKYVSGHPLNVDSISAPSLRVPGTSNTNVLNGTAKAVERIQ